MNCPICGTALVPKKPEWQKPGNSFFCPNPAKCKSPTRTYTDRFSGQKLPCNISEKDCQGVQPPLMQAAPASKVGNTQAPSVRPNVQSGDREASIEKQVCLKAATEIVVAMIANGKSLNFDPNDDLADLTAVYAHSLYAKMFSNRPDAAASDVQAQAARLFAGKAVAAKAAKKAQQEESEEA